MVVVCSHECSEGHGSTASEFAGSWRGDSRMSDSKGKPERSRLTTLKEPQLVNLPKNERGGLLISEDTWGCTMKVDPNSM